MTKLTAGLLSLTLTATTAHAGDIVRPMARPVVSPCAWVDKGGYWNIPPGCHGRREQGSDFRPTVSIGSKPSGDGDGPTVNATPPSGDTPTVNATPPSGDPEPRTQWRDGDRWFDEEETRGWKNRDGHETRVVP